MKLLLDTNAYSALMRGDPSIAMHVRDATEVLVPATVVGESLYGFAGGSRAEENTKRLRSFLSARQVRFLATDFSVCNHYGRIAFDLRTKGRPIPTNDIWIAAHTIAEGASLLSADHHFENIDGLNWSSP